MVWVGYDDNRAARLSGSAAAAADLGRPDGALSPEPLALAKPERIEMVWIDPQSGLRGGTSCPGALELPFVQGSAPQDRAPCSGAMDAAVEAAGEVGQAVSKGVKRAKSWLERLFGR